MFNTDNLILFTKENGKRIIMDAQAIESIEELEQNLVRICTARMDVEIALSLEQVSAVLKEVEKKVQTKHHSSLYDKLIAEKKSRDTNPNMTQSTEELANAIQKAVAPE